MEMATPYEDAERKEAEGHYRTAGKNLILLGVLNGAVALGYLFANAGEAFIAFDMMLLFSVAFIAVGTWMRTYRIESDR